jgi:acetyl esterase/lipase
MSTLMTPTDYVALPVVQADDRFAYGQQAEQFGELFLPPERGPTTPVILLLHGGCWQHAFGLAPLGQLARGLTQLGAAVCNLEYRRLGGGGGWPSTFHDVVDGAAALGRLAEEHGFDASRMVVAGHSAGGHLALWLAGCWRLATDSVLRKANAAQPRVVVSLAGVGDLEGALSSGICRGAPADLMGGSPQQQPQRYAEASPHALLPLAVPHWHVVGDNDVLVPAAHVEQFAAAAVTAGDTVHMTRVANAGHFEIVTAGSPAWPEVRRAFEHALDTVR